MSTVIENILIDLGHGGIDSNGEYTTAPAKMYEFPDGQVVYEGVINRQIGEKVIWLLEGYRNFNTVSIVNPADPRDMPLGERVKIANSFDADKTIFISIHCNAGKGTGFEIFTTRGVTQSDYLAEDVANAVEHLYEESKLNLRYDFSDGDKDKEADFYVLRRTKCPAVLLECGFFDNKKDVEFLLDEGFQYKLAEAIVNGIMEYIYD